jgi:hypothetical protein
MINQVMFQKYFLQKNMVKRIHVLHNNEIKELLQNKDSINTQIKQDRISVHLD